MEISSSKSISKQECNECSGLHAVTFYCSQCEVFFCKDCYWEQTHFSHKSKIFLLKQILAPEFIQNNTEMIFFLEEQLYEKETEEGSQSLEELQNSIQAALTRFKDFYDASQKQSMFWSLWKSKSIEMLKDKITKIRFTKPQKKQDWRAKRKKGN